MATKLAGGRGGVGLSGRATTNYFFCGLLKECLGGLTQLSESDSELVTQYCLARVFAISNLCSNEILLLLA